MTQQSWKKLHDTENRNYVVLTTHQICTPLTIIKGYLSFIQEGNFGEVPEKIQKILDLVQKSANTLVDTVQDAIRIRG